MSLLQLWYWQYWLSDDSILGDDSKIMCWLYVQATQVCFLSYTSFARMYSNATKLEGCWDQTVWGCNHNWTECDSCVMCCWLLWPRLEDQRFRDQHRLLELHSQHCKYYTRWIIMKLKFTFYYIIFFIVVNIFDAQWFIKRSFFNFISLLFFSQTKCMLDKHKGRFWIVSSICN